MAVMEDTCTSMSAESRRYGISWPLVIAVLALTGVLTSGLSNALLADADTYWHLATGDWILRNFAVPGADPFSHTMSGAPWAPHEWLSQVIYASVSRYAGWGGLVVLVSALFAWILARITRFLVDRMEPVHALLLTALAAAMLMGHLLVRPHVFGWVSMVLWVGALINATEKQLEPPWWTLGLMVLWANLHSSFVLGLALSIVIALDAVQQQPTERRRMAARHWLSFLALSSLAAMVTPSGWRGLLFPVEVMGMPFSLDVIHEWRSPDFHQPQILELWLMLVLAVACSARLRVPALRLLLLLGLTHLALKHQRQIAILGLIVPFLLAAPFAASRRHSAPSGRDVESVDRLFRALAAPATPNAKMVAAVVSILVMLSTLILGRFEPLVERTPAAAIQAANAAGAKGPVFNAYNFGGYLIYRGIPVFIDGRSDMYGDSLLKKYVSAVSLSGPDALQSLLTDYRIGWTLLEPGTPAVTLLDHLSGWRRVYSDDIAIVHVRSESAAP